MFDTEFFLRMLTNRYENLNVAELTDEKFKDCFTNFILMMTRFTALI